MSRFYKVFIQNDRWKLYLEGLGNSLAIAFFGFIISFAIGTFLAVLLYNLEKSKKHKWLVFIINSIVNIVRAFPVLLQLLLAYFEILVFIDSALIVAILVFGFNSSAYMCEIVRSGLKSVDNTQYDAGISLGLTRWQCITHIILPQGLKNCLPSISNELITVLKMTSIAGWISLVDLTQAANIISINTFDYLLPLTIVAFVYILLVAIINVFFKYFEKRLKKYD